MPQTRRNALLLILLSVVIGVAPLAMAIGAGAVGEALGCTVHEGFANPCPIFGIDIGGLLYSLGVMGWMALISIPAGGLMLLVGLAMFLWSWPSWIIRAGAILIAAAALAFVVWFFTGEL